MTLTQTVVEADDAHKASTEIATTYVFPTVNVVIGIPVTAVAIIKLKKVFFV